MDGFLEHSGGDEVRHGMAWHLEHGIHTGNLHHDVKTKSEYMNDTHAPQLISFITQCCRTLRE